MSLDALRKYGLNVNRVAVGVSGLDDVRQTSARLKALEEAGITMFSTGEILTHEAFTFAQRLLHHSEKIVIVSGIVRALEREPKNAASAQWTILQQYPDRYLMGLGASAATRERGKGTVQFLRDYMTELDKNTERLTGQPGRYPRILGGYSVGTITLSAEMCDGLITGLSTPEHTAWARGIIGPERFLGVTVGIMISEDVERSRQLRREGLAYYLRLPHQINKFKNMGFSEEDYAPPGSDHLIDTVAPHGPMEQMIEYLRSHLQAGADQVNVRISGSEPNEEIDQLAYINEVLNRPE